MPSAQLTSFDQMRSAILHAWDLKGVHHGFMSRLGGASAGPWASFNLSESVGDDPTAVRINWEKWRAAYPAMRVARLKQVHGNTIREIGTGYDGERWSADGMVTASRGIALGIFTADCVPILMVDETRGVAGALHAGWRGTLADIAEAGVRAMVALGGRPHAIRAAMGPAIGSCCFEVDADLAERFARSISHARAHTRAGNPGKAYLDLRAIVRGQLERAGLAPVAITSVGRCTRCAADRYFSRRAAGGATTGLQMSFIGFEA
ncbi:MAG TPA: peptidoglycan editing factor PgeF [Candidatus Binataceae bacterium]|nr:peptidoglycan editing factor PgeF [Candidatus Binataceae bacterium]